MASRIILEYQRALRLLSSSWTAITKRVTDGAFRKVAAEFFTEVAVLVFVFPVLDTIVQFGSRKVTAPLALGSLALSGLFLLLAAILYKPGGD